MGEIWKPIKGYEGIYEISSYGKVKSIPRIIEINVISKFGKSFTRKRKVKGGILSECDDGGGYKMVILSSGGVYKTTKIHKLVARAFLKASTKIRNQVNHINGIKHDNRAKNLEWVSVRENISHGLLLSGKSEYIGANQNAQSKNWAARIKVNKKLIHLGMFKTSVAASNACIKYAKKHNIVNKYQTKNNIL